MKTRGVHYLAPIGRALIGLVFVQAALGKLLNIPATLEGIAAHGLVPAEPYFAMSTGLELVGGLLLLFGYKTRLGALALILFLVPVTAVYHAFWTAPAEQAMAQRFAFMGNLAIVGGLIYVLALGAGPVSVDARQKRLAAERRYGVATAGTGAGLGRRVGAPPLARSARRQRPPRWTSGAPWTSR